MRLLNLEGNTSKASHSDMSRFFKYVNIPNLSSTCFKARHRENLNICKAMILLNPKGNTSKASHSNKISFSKMLALKILLVHVPKLDNLRNRVPLRLRLLDQEGNISKVSHSHILSFFQTCQSSKSFWHVLQSLTF